MTEPELPDVGHECWSTSQVHPDEGSGAPVGGIVVARCSVIDPDTGEHGKGLALIDQWHGGLERVVLALGDVDLDSARPATDRAITALIRRLARSIADRSRGGSRMSGYEVRAGRDLVELQNVLVERNGPKFYGLDTPAPVKLAEPRPVADPNVEALTQ